MYAARSVEAEVVIDLPANLAQMIGQVIVTYARLEHKLTMLAGLILQLDKAEVRIALRMPRAVDRFDMALDLFAVKDIDLSHDVEALRDTLSKATSERDIIGHGLWLRHPDTGELFLQLTRGKWPKDMADGAVVKRTVFPQAIPYGLEECKRAYQLCLDALAGVDAIGAELDAALRASPEKFRLPLRVTNPLGNRTSRDKRRQPKPSRA